MTDRLVCAGCGRSASMLLTGDDASGDRDALCWACRFDRCGADAAVFVEYAGWWLRCAEDRVGESDWGLLREAVDGLESGGEWPWGES